MASALDKVKKAASGQLGNAGFIALSVGMADNKLKGLLEGLKDLATWKATGMAGVVAGGFLAIRSAIGLAAKETGALQAALDRLVKMRNFDRQLSPFVKGLQQARSRMAELVRLRKSSPFGLDELAGAATKLTAYTRGLADSTTVVAELSDVASAAGASLGDVVDRFANLSQSMRTGQGLDEAIDQWKQFGTLTTEDAKRLHDMATEGMPVADMLNVVRNGMKKAAGASTEAAKEIDALRSRFEEAKDTMMANFGKGFLASEKATLENLVAIMDNLAPIASKVGQALADMAGKGAEVASVFYKILTAIPGLGSGIAGLIRLFTFLGAGATALVVVRLGAITSKMVGVVTAMASGATAAKLMAKANMELAKSAELAAAASAHQARGQEKLAAEMSGGAILASAKGNALKGVATGAGFLGTGMKAVAELGGACT
jgi:hypothetical protein